jgi:hypothetical protein
MSEASGPPLPNSQATPTSRVSFGSRYEFGQFRRATSGYEDSMVERFDIDRQIERRMSLVPEFLRPLSAPVPSNSETLSQCLPPRRELPFPKARVTTKPCTPIDLLPSLEPKLRAGESRVDGVAQFVAPANATPIFNRSMKRVAQRRTNYAPPVTQGGISGSLAKESPGIDGRDARPQMLVEREEEPSPLAAKSAAVSRPSTAPGLRSKVMGPATRKRPNETEPDMVPVSKQARKMVDRATQTQTWSGRDHTVPLALTTGVGRPLSTTIDEAIQHPESSMDDIEAFVSRHKQRPPPQELWQRPGYSEASPEERQAIINDFICENLDNEDFLKLCEDTGNVWRRIGLEL